jgi:uncharacterized protein YdaU (DUF1376 family)
MSRAWMPIYWGDFLRDTRHLSKWQRDSYMMLIAHYWTTGALPDDDQQLARITDCTLDQWLADKPVVQALFHHGWRHKRIEAELRRATEITARMKALGKKGGDTTALNLEKLRWQSQRLR